MRRIIHQGIATNHTLKNCPTCKISANDYIGGNGAYKFGPNLQYNCRNHKVNDGSQRDDPKMFRKNKHLKTFMNELQNY